MLRASSYNIYVDLPDNKEDMLLVHGYTGAYDLVSQRVASYVRSLEASKPPRPLYGEWSPEPRVDGQVTPPPSDVIDILKKRGYLTEMSVADEDRFFSNFATIQHQSASHNLSYVLMPTYNCNLRCSYCFQDHMRTQPEFRHLLRTMSREVVDRVFAALPQIEAHHGVQVPANARPHRSFSFFGGESLLASSRPIIEYIIQKAQESSEASFWAVTNATELDAYRDLIGPKLLSFFQITLDGPPAEHDQRRIYADGSGSFERIAANITMALELGARVSVRMNIDRNNINQLPALADEIIARGWNTHPNFSAYTAPIHASNDHTDIKTTFSSWELDQALDQLRAVDPDMLIIARPDDRLLNQARSIFTTQATPGMRASFCGSHSGMYVIDAFGDLYACWERTGDPSVRIGSITLEGTFVLEEQMNTMWRSRNVTTNPICRRCRYAMYCGGGCASMAQLMRGEFFTNLCDGFAARFRASVAEAYQQHSAGQEAMALVDKSCDL